MRCANCGNVYPNGLVACNRCGARPVAEMKRPAAVTLLGVLHALGGSLLLLLAAGGAYATTRFPPEAAPYVIVAAIVLGVLGLVQLLTGSGLLKLRNYGRVLLIIQNVIGLLNVPVGTVISIMILMYMLKPGMRLLFSQRPADNLTPEESAAVAEVQRSGLGTAIVVVTVLALAASLLIVPIIAAIAVPNFLNAVQRGKQMRTMGDVRMVATAVESYSIDANQYPVVESVEDLALLLEPTYVRTLPRLDGWSRELRYEGSPRAYVIASAGKDGIWEEEDLRAYEAGSFDGFDGDIVFADGGFVRGPDNGVEYQPMGGSAPAEEVEQYGEDVAPAVVGGGPSGTAHLQLLDWRLQAKGGKAVVEGAVLNVSAATLEGATVVASLVTESGEEVATAEGSLPTLEPGGTTVFSVSAPLQPSMFTAIVTVLDANGEAVPMSTTEQPEEAPPEEQAPQEPPVEEPVEEPEGDQ